MSANLGELLSGGGSPSNVYGVHLQETVAASTTEFTRQVSWESPVTGTIIEMSPWHVPGSQDALEVFPVIESRGETSARSIPDFADDGEEFITGEPEGTPVPLRRSIRRDESISIHARNTNASNAYRFRYVFVVVGRDD